MAAKKLLEIFPKLSSDFNISEITLDCNVLTVDIECSRMVISLISLYFDNNCIFEIHISGKCGYVKIRNAYGGPKKCTISGFLNTRYYADESAREDMYETVKKMISILM